jgi:outer membrane biosynthesis protein TonB
VTLEGSSADIQKKLEANPKTKIPQILFTVYQHVFNSIYILASILNTPYPPPDLLHPMAEKIKILPSTPKPQPQPEQTAAPEPTPENPPAQTTPGTGTQQPTGGQPATSEPAEQTSAAAASDNTQTAAPNVVKASGRRRAACTQPLYLDPNRNSLQKTIGGGSYR